MRNKLAIFTMIFVLLFSISGCKRNKEEAITDKTESTIIKNAKSADEFMKKEDYKSMAYAYIYNLKEGTKSYKAVTTGTVSAKVLFIDYLIDYYSATIKNGNTFFVKDHSTSTLMDIDNEFYMVNLEKILYSKDLKKYQVYSLEDYHKISYTPNQFTVMGYVFNDESILNCELVSNDNGIISIKYTLDNELATNLVKLDLKSNGGLSSYPEYSLIELTLTMTNDFTPVGYSLNAIYKASKRVLGSTTVHQQSSCVISNVGEDIVIDNEAFYIEKLGQAPTDIVITDEVSVKDDLLESVKNLEFGTGISVDGNLILDLMDMEFTLDIKSNLIFDINRLSDEKIYEVASLHSKLEGSEEFNTLISLVKAFAGDKLGDYASLLDQFKGIDIVYDGEGSLYLNPYNQDDKCYTVLKIKLTDIIHSILSKVNLYNLVSNSNNDLVTFERIDGSDDANYQVEVLLNNDTIASIKEKIDNFFNNPNYAIIKTLLGYEEFDSLNIMISVVDGKVSKLDANLKYLKTETNEEGIEEVKPTTFVRLALEAKADSFDFASSLEEAKANEEAFNSVKELKEKINELNSNVYVSNIYINNATSIISEYNELTDLQKVFIDLSSIRQIESNIDKASAILNFFKTYYQYDLSNLNNNDILALAKAYKERMLDKTLLKKEIGETDYNILMNFNESVDYSCLDSALLKIVSEDEATWGLTSEEVNGIKLLIEIAKADSTVNNDLLVRLLFGAIPMDLATLESKINSLAN